MIVLPAFLGLSVALQLHALNANPGTGDPLILWYTRPASNWNEALPIGNGRLGAMIYGGIGTEMIQLNEETVWAGEPGNNLQPELREALPEIRQLIFSGACQDAQDRVNAIIPRAPKAGNNYGMPYQPVGNLILTFPDSSGITAYRRSLDIGQAVANVTYVSHHVQYKREMIASLDHDVIGIAISADRPGAVSCTLQLNTPHTNSDIHISDNTLILKGTSDDHENKRGRVAFTTLVKPQCFGGHLAASEHALTVTGADSLVIWISTGTNFRHYNDLSGNPDKQALGLLDSVRDLSFRSVCRAHTRK